MKVSAIIAAAGQGKRMGRDQNKIYLSLEGQTILGLTLKQLEQIDTIEEFIIVVRADEMDYCRNKILQKINLVKPYKMIVGGKERQDSVRAGLAALSDHTDYVMVHDGARPLVSIEIIDHALEEAKKHGTAVLAVPVKDTIKVVDDAGFVESTPTRAKLRAIQTPQIFRKDLIIQAYEKAEEIGFVGTDDASLVEAMGQPVRLVPGSYENIKITTPEDLLLAQEILRGRSSCE